MTLLFAGSAGCPYGSDEHETTPEPLKPEEVTELQALLQTDDIAPVDRATFGRRLAEIIMRVRNLRKPRRPAQVNPAIQLFGSLLLFAVPLKTFKKFETRSAKSRVVP